MPINKNDYPTNWLEISIAIRKRSGGQCECQGSCGLHIGRRCDERNGAVARWARGKIILTVAHLNHAPMDVRDENLRAMCQRCHLRYDSKYHVLNRRRTRLLKQLEREPELALDK